MELDLNALQELPAEDEACGSNCKLTCVNTTAKCPTTTCLATSSQL